MFDNFDDLTLGQQVIIIVASLALIGGVILGFLLLHEGKTDQREHAFFMVGCIESRKRADDCERQYYWYKRWKESEGKNDTGKVN